MTHKLFTDGGARGNPGPGGIGVVIKDSQDSVIFEMSKYIGNSTNNEAEYKALIEGLKQAVEKNITDIECYTDSELMCKQILGEYKVKQEHLQILYNEVKSYEKNFIKFSIQHIRREKNKRADKLVNEALDKNGI